MSRKKKKDFQEWTQQAKEEHFSPKATLLTDKKTIQA